MSRHLRVVDFTSGFNYGSLDFLWYWQRRWHSEDSTVGRHVEHQCTSAVGILQEIIMHALAIVNLCFEGTLFHAINDMHPC